VLVADLLVDERAVEVLRDAAIGSEVPEQLVAGQPWRIGVGVGSSIGGGARERQMANYCVFR
jgi:hypothetical protein